jgi:rhamnosyl/mannosyltransferase
MKICHLGKYYFPERGGIETYYYQLSREFVKKKNIVSVIVSNTARWRKIETIDGVKVIRMEKLFRAMNSPVTFPFLHMIFKLKPDIIHLHCPNPWAELNLFIYKLLGGKGKVVVTYHSDVVHYSMPLKVLDFFRKFYLYPLLKLFSSKIIATSQNYVDGSSVLKTVRDKVSVVPLFIDTGIYKPQPKKREEKYVLLFEGRLTKYKGLEYLIEAIKHVSTIRSDFILYIVGGGRLECKLKKMVKELGLTRLIKFTGLVTDTIRDRYYSMADAFILPSIYKSEAFSFSQLEAMAFGIPVISCNIHGSGVPWVNQNQVTGIVVRPEDSKDLAKAIIQLLADSATRETYGKNARQRVLKFFSKERVITQIANIYKNAR